ncbi:hypothetical protein NQ314_013354 [Rhamnusium bicolor]|uniref:Helicase C-terminal domain-containing protein n=1 Tax=Rhamnusium bicolor TaxID=1586634 RepID=A0AAV8X7F3_9CUCU|nr:hypothetical protein NQ314_013354 [Rhamnusium bicolor]
MTPAQEKNLWSGLVDHLKRNDLLPVVAFTFSRQKCDNNAINLTNLDLTSEKEKGHISMFFNKCIRCLKEPDQNIPQILNMRDILNRGIGVHHSGILPIIKEIVEMLFQRGLIKLLFATETFAMGVNMPARTVVFDSVKKHDGKELRDLEPAEYIQMAGRAGRRGLDSEGTVIILCKHGVPTEENLKKMMLGKPSSLVSQFRLTYGMVLSLLRVESLSVEGMMSRSFGEADHQKNMAEIKKQLEEVDHQMEELCRQQISSYLEPLVKFYDSATAYLQVKKQIMDNVMLSSKLQKTMTPGRVLVITCKNHINKLALLLQVARSKQVQYKVLVLTDSSTETNKEFKEDIWYHMLGLAQDKLFLPLGTPGHEILTISSTDIFEISAKSLKLNTEYIISDFEKRQMERFKDSPPGQTCVQAVQELHRLTLLTNDSSKSSNKLEYLHFIVDLRVNEPEMYNNLKKMYELKDRIVDYLPSTQIPNFAEQFATVFTRKFLEEKKKNLEFRLSNAMELKGRVACEMGMNELLITELVLRNILTKLRASEVAALLSALVFRVKSRSETIEDENLPSDLRKGIAEIKTVHQEIANLELSMGIQTDEFQEDLNFGLVHVVYEWASDKPFADIMQLTDIQEGIIVRCIQQLNETICDVRDAARIIGDPELQNKMEEASTAIKRDIVFAASLYTHGENL